MTQASDREFSAERHAPSPAPVRVDRLVVVRAAAAFCLYDASCYLALLLAACCFLVSPSATAAQTRNVLLLFSYHRLLPANLEIERELRETLANSGDRNVEFFAEFLDLPRFSGPAYEQTVATYLNEKYATRPPETIVVVAESALEFLLRHRARLFPGVPVVHLGIDKSYLQSMQPFPADVVGVPVEYDFLGTIQLVLRWHPNAQRLVVVTGTSDRDRMLDSDLRAGLARLEVGPQVEFLAGLSHDAVVKRLGELGTGDVVFTPGYFRDSAGREFAPRESAVLMAAASGAPVYGPFSTFIGTGVVGGRMPTFVEMGRQTAKAVDGLLDGVPPAKLRLPASIPAQVQIDWHQARKWGIGANNIPDDAIVHFRQPTFWEAYRNTAILVAGVILLQAALIAALLIERRRRRQAASELEESENRMNLAAYAARLSMWIWDFGRGKVWTTTKLRVNAGLQARAPVDFDQVLETVHPEDRERFDRAVRQAVAKDEELDVEYRVLQPDGAVRWIAARGRAEKSAGERNWAQAPALPGPKSEGGGETKWVVPEKFFDQLGTVLDTVAPLPGEEALYGQFRVLLDAAAKDPAIKKALTEAAVETEREVIEPFFEWKRNGRPAGNGWNRSTNNARFGHDYYNRTGTAKSNMFDNKPTETQYVYTDDDSEGARLDGKQGYEVTFASGQEPPVSGFWSMTLYNNEHFFHPNTLKRYSLGTKNKNLQKGKDGSLTLYVGAKSPGANKESNWLPAPDGHFSLYIRAYWGQQGILDGSWKPPIIRKVK